ncbi:MAG: four helix bundle protein [Bacteroidales bacterium]|nr:four helix bundle protein [Bacteroidales bacterium]
MEQHEERISSFFRFEDLRVYDKATSYATWLVGVLKGIDGTDPLKSAFCHSAFDIAINIAEGSSRTKSQFEHCLKVAKTAVRECVVYTEVASNSGMLDEMQKEQSRENLMELTRMLGALIISLERSSERRSQAPAEEPAEEADPYASDGMSY